MSTSFPRRTRVYRNHHLDSRRWDLYQPRDGDVVVSTAYKAGTTWTQLIVLTLLDPGASEIANVSAESPWPDRRFGQSDEQSARMLAERDPNRPLCLKTHLPLDALPYHPQVRYVVVGRDPRDVFMSLYNHYSNYNDVMYARLNDEGRVGEPMPRCPDDPRQLWRPWITRGWFEWEQDGWPFWSNLGHTRSYWDYRDLPNILFVHYGDLWADPHAHIARIASFIGLETDDELIEQVVQRTRFDEVRRNADKLMGRLNETWRGGSKAFFHSGGGGRWRGVLTDEDLALYEDAKSRVLEPECARWLEGGGELPSTEDRS
jgi:aryl sulfotransferase